MKKYLIQGLLGLIIAWVLAPISMAAPTRAAASGTITFGPASRIITLKVANESPSRRAFVRGDYGTKTLAVFELGHSSVLPVMVNSFMVKKSTSVSQVYILIDDYIYYAEPTTFSNEMVFVANIDKVIEATKTAKITVLGNISPASDYSDAWVEFYGVTSNADLINSTGAFPARHAVVAGLTDEGISNTSVRTSVSPSQPATLGFVVRGEKTTQYPVLVRAVGPSLSKFGIQNPLQDPSVKVFDSSRSQVYGGENDNWNPGLTSIFQEVGAFPLPSGSLDSAVLVYLSPGAYTVEIKGYGTGIGEVLLEVYQLPLRFSAKG